MITNGSLETEEVLSKEKAPPVKDSWLKAYMVGNVLWPQMEIGIEIMVTDAVLKDRPENWDLFVKSELSSQQLKDLGKFATYAHRAHKVHAVTSEYAGHFDRLIPEDRLIALWDATRPLATIVVSNYILVSDGKRDFDFESLEPAAHYQAIVARVDEFLKNPANAKKIAQLQQIILEVKTLMESPTGRDLSIKHQEAMKNDSHQNDPTFKLKFIDLATKTLQQKYPAIKSFDWLMQPRKMIEVE